MFFYYLFIYKKMEQINFFSELNDWKNQEFKNIEREKKFNRNHCFSFKNLGNF